MGVCSVLPTNRHPSVTKDVYEKFNKSLVTDGCLFVGNTEQIIGYRDMGYSYDHLFFYRKTN